LSCTSGFGLLRSFQLPGFDIHVLRKWDDLVPGIALDLFVILDGRRFYLGLSRVRMGNGFGAMYMANW
jgi:hypothetical protein